MDAREDDIRGLLTLQQIDLDIAKKQKQLDELPQRTVIVQARKKRESMQERLDKVEKLKADAQHRRTRVNDEDASLATKESDIHTALDSTNGDFRNVEAQTKELENIANQREDLAVEAEQIDGELKKITDVEEQINLVLKDTDEKEAAAVESFQSEGGALKAAIVQLEKQREDVTSSLPADLVRLYSKTAEHTGGVALGRLQGNQCGVCRSTIDSGRLIDLRSQAPLAVCPACKRILIID